MSQTYPVRCYHSYFIAEDTESGVNFNFLPLLLQPWHFHGASVPCRGQNQKALQQEGIHFDPWATILSTRQTVIFLGAQQIKNSGRLGWTLICSLECHIRRNKCSGSCRSSWSPHCVLLLASRIWTSHNFFLRLIPNPLNQHVPTLLTWLFKK